MVDRKGAGYALEGIVAVGAVFVFVLGGLQVPQGQDWNSFRRQVSADDLTFVLQESGYLNHALAEGEIGSVQTAFAEISERNVEVSGLVSNLPINENKVAFYTKPSRRYTQGLMDASSGSCAGDLDEIASRSEEPVLQTDGAGVDSNYPDEKVYLADLDPNQAGGNNIRDYDSVWVDNGTDCQFSNAEGPFYRDEFIKWGPHHYDVEWINGNTNELRLFNATQAVRFRNLLNSPVNSVDTFVTVDSVNFTEVDRNTYNVLVVRTREGVYDISANQGIIEDYLDDGSLLVLASLDSSNFENGDFLERAGFQYIDLPYKGGYPGGISGTFPKQNGAQDVQTYFNGLNGEISDLSIRPPGIVSNTSNPISVSDSILYSPSVSHKYSLWNINHDSMTDLNSIPEGAPESACYSPGNVDEGDITYHKFDFPGIGDYNVINVKLGAIPGYCDENQRGIMVDLNGDGNYDEKGEGPFLNNEILKIGDRSYAINVTFAENDPNCDKGECLGFKYVGERGVELISRRQFFSEFDGGKIAISGYERSYSPDDKKLLVSTIHWLRGDQLAFTGKTDPEGISTSTYSGIKDSTYLPYELNLRWSK